MLFSTLLLTLALWSCCKFTVITFFSELGFTCRCGIRISHILVTCKTVFEAVLNVTFKLCVSCLNLSTCQIEGV